MSFRMTTDDTPPDAVASDEQLLERVKRHAAIRLNALFVLCIGFGALVGVALAVLVGNWLAQLAIVWGALLVVYLAIAQRAQAEVRRDEVWREYLERSFKVRHP
jgi:Flp pilus assembly protein TadB